LGATSARLGGSAQGWSQRAVPLRFGQEVQALSRRNWSVINCPERRPAGSRSPQGELKRPEFAGGRFV
jgi:hypothetical protein